MGVLDLPDSSFTKVWDKTLEILQGDEWLSGLPVVWIIPDGSTPPNAMPSMFPAVRLEPTIGPYGYFGTSGHRAFLLVKVRTFVKSRDVADRFNLFGAIVHAFYPKGQEERQFQIKQEFMFAGAETGEYEFPLPPTEPDPRAWNDGIQVCDGQIRISVTHDINP